MTLLVVMVLNRLNDAGYFVMRRSLSYVRITGIFEMPVGDSGDNNAMLAGQLVWHFLDGFAGRAADQPDEASGTYRKYVVPVEAFDEQLYFVAHF